MPDAERPKLPPGVNRIVRRRDGAVVATYYYHRATKTRLVGEPGTAEFDASLRAAVRPQTVGPLPPASLASLIDDFEKSWEFKKGVRTTRHAREVIYRAARERFHWVQVRDLNRRAIRDELMKWRDEMAATPRKADSYIGAMQRLLSWAYDRGRIEYNHGLRIARLTPSGYSRRDHIWTPLHEAKLLRSCDPEIRELYLFALFTGARQSDCARMKWSQFDGKWLSFVPAKTSHSTAVEVNLPVHELPPFMDLIGDLSQCTEYMLTTDRGNPWSSFNIIRRFAAAAREAGLSGEDLTFHDIRGTTVSRLYEAGCTDAEVASITGHAIGCGSKLGDYANRSRMLAVHAFRKWGAAMGTMNNVALFPVAKS
jgi:integrase